MMLRHMGLLEEAKDYHYWVHKYRSEVFYRKHGFVDLNRHLLSGKYFVFKVIRNPYDRAVSSYLHVMKYCLTNPQDRMSFEQYLLNLKNNHFKFTINGHIDWAATTHSHPQ